MRALVLYRGSSVLIERLLPHQAYDWLDTRGTTAGVFVPRTAPRKTEAHSE